MTQEDKELLLKDLCARLPYGVKVDIPDLFVSTKNNIEVLNEIFCGDDGEFRCNGSGMLIKHVKPYLFPLSSMPEEQLYNNPIGFSQMLTIKADRDWENITINRRAYYKLVDWFNKNHFDYRGLIPMGLANNATGKNIY